MSSLELAVIGDIHGNAYALEAVLADIQRRGGRTIVNLGDNANGPVDPKRTMQLLHECNATHVRGNGDRMVGGGEPVRRSSSWRTGALS